MSRKSDGVPLEGFVFWVILFFLGGMAIGSLVWANIGADVPRISSRVEYVPSDLVMVTFSELAWGREPRIICSVGGEILEEAGVSLHVVNSTGEIARTEDTTFFGPRDVRVIPDISAGTRIPVRVDELGHVDALNAEDICYPRSGQLSYRVTARQSGAVLYDEHRTCWAEFDSLRSFHDRGVIQDALMGCEA